MLGAGRSSSPVVRGVGAVVALIAVAGYLIFDWSFNDSTNTIPTVIGIIVAVSAVGWTLYSRIYSDGGL